MRRANRAGAAFAVLGVASALVIFGLFGLLGNSLHPAVNPSNRLTLPSVLLLVGVVLLLVGGLVYRSALRRGEVAAGGIWSQGGVAALTAGVVVGFLLAATVPVPAAVSVEVAVGPFEPVVPGTCYSYENTESYSLPVESNVRVHYLFEATEGYPFVNVSLPSGQVVYSGGPEPNGSGSFVVPTARETPQYLVSWAVLVCAPGANATLGLWLNATQSGPLW